MIELILLGLLLVALSVRALRNANRVIEEALRPQSDLEGW